MKVQAIVQARIASKRLPGKLLRPILGKPVLCYVIEALQAAKTIKKVILAVPENSRAYVEHIARRYNCGLVTGSEEDVLSRYAKAMRTYPALHLIRATADNPLVAPKWIDKIVNMHIKKRADLSHYLGIPLGSGVEVISNAALYKSDRLAWQPSQREHITQFIYANKNMFSVLEPQVKHMPPVKISIDTEQDFVKISRIFEMLYNGNPLQLSEILALYRKRPELFTDIHPDEAAELPTSIEGESGVLDEKKRSSSG